MRVMVFAKATEASENSAPPTTEAFAESMHIHHLSPFTISITFL